MGCVNTRPMIHELILIIHFVFWIRISSRLFDRNKTLSVCLQNVVRERGELKNENQNKQGGAHEKIRIVSGKCSKITSYCYKNWIPPPGGVFAIIACFGLLCYAL